MNSSNIGSNQDGLSQQSNKSQSSVAPLVSNGKIKKEARSSSEDEAESDSDALYEDNPNHH